MAQIRLDFPTISAPTQSVLLSPAFVQIQPFRRSAAQRLHVSESGVVHHYAVASVVEQILEMQITDLQEDDAPSGHGIITLLGLVENFLEYRRHTLEMTDPDGIITEVRFWSPELELREAEGQVRVQGRFSGRLLWRKEIEP